MDTSSSGPDFDYLLGMNFWSVTLERKEELIRKKNEKLEELNVLKMKTPGDIWNTDLDKFLDKVSQPFFFFRMFFHSNYFRTDIVLGEN